MIFIASLTSSLPMVSFADIQLAIVLLYLLWLIGFPYSFGQLVEKYSPKECFTFQHVKNLVLPPLHLWLVHCSLFAFIRHTFLKSQDFLKIFVPHYFLQECVPHRHLDLTASVLKACVALFMCSCVRSLFYLGISIRCLIFLPLLCHFALVHPSFLNFFGRLWHALPL